MSGARRGARANIERNRDEVLGYRPRTPVGSSSCSVSSDEMSWNDDHLVIGSWRGESVTTNPFLKRLEYKARNLDAANDELGDEIFDREMLSENPRPRYGEANRFVSQQARESSDQRVRVEVSAELSRLDNGAVEPEQYRINNLHQPNHSGLSSWIQQTSDFNKGRYEWLRKNSNHEQDHEGEPENVQYDAGNRLEVAVAEGIDACMSDVSSDEDGSALDDDESVYTLLDANDYYYHEESISSGGEVDPAALDGERVRTSEGGGMDVADGIGVGRSNVGQGELAAAARDDGSSSSRFSTVSSQLLEAGCHHDDQSSSSRFSTKPEGEADEENVDGGDQFEASIPQGEEAASSNRDANDRFVIEEPEDINTNVGSNEVLPGNQVSGHYGDYLDVPSEVEVLHLNQDEANAFEQNAEVGSIESMPVKLNQNVERYLSLECVKLPKGTKADPSVMKPKMQVGDKVYAKWSHNNEWYHGKIRSVGKEMEESLYGATYNYRVRFDDKDSEIVSEDCLVIEREYPLLTEPNHDWKRMKQRLMSVDGLQNVNDASSSDGWYAKFGYYVICVGDQIRAYTYLYEALLARDAYVIQHSYPHVTLTDLALPGEWAEPLGMEVSKIEKTNMQQEKKTTIQQEKKTRKSQCRQCPACRRDDCGKCDNCLDKKKFGGPDRKRQKCIHRRCKKMS